MKVNAKEMLIANLQSLQDMSDWLTRAYKTCSKIPLKSKFTPEEFDAFEVLTSRFARTIDLLINKVFRSIDQVELEPQATIIDVINRAHKRDLFKSADEVRKMKELRNEIAHEYTAKDLQQIFANVLVYTPTLLEVIANTLRYCHYPEYQK